MKLPYIKHLINITRILLAMLLINTLTFAQQSVSIGDTQVKANAILYLKGNGTQGLIIPLVSSNGGFGEQGMLVFNSTEKKLYYHNGTSWIEAGGGTSTSEIDGIIGNEVTQVNAARGGLEVTGSGTLASPLTIGLIQGTADGQVLKWNNTTKKWELGTTSGTDNQDLSLSGTTLSLTNDSSPVTLGALSILNAVGTTEITNNAITNADINSSAAIAVSKLAPGTNGQILSTSAGVPTWINSTGGTDSQDLSLAGTTLALTNDSSPVTLGALSILDAVSTSEITNGSITDADVSTTAALAVSKLAPGTNGQVLTTNAGVVSWQAASGASTLDALNDATVTAATTGQILVNDGAGQFKNVSISGDVSLTSAGVSTIQNGVIVNADVNASAAIDGTKINPNFAAQVIQSTGGTLSGARTGAAFNIAGTTTNTYGTYSTVSSTGATSYGNYSKTSGGTSEAYGAFGEASGAPQNFGVYGSATGTTKNYGVFGSALNGTENWAGYFKGNTAIIGALGVGTAPDFGTAGQVLTSAGSGAPPTWTTVGSSSLISNPGTNNLFAGINAGDNNSTGINNAFFGANAGEANTTGTENTFIGRNAGVLNTGGSYNVYIGKDAGNSMVTGNLNTFIGYQAGHTANGINAGTFLGRLAGGNTTTGSFNTFLGEQAGLSNTTGQSNTMVGRNTGITNLTGSTITLLGSGADVNSDGLSNATAIGANAVVSASNTLVLGNNANVGIGTSTPGASSLYVNVASGTSNPDALTVVNAYNGTASKTGITNAVTLDGTGLRYGIENAVNGNSGSASAVYGISNLIGPSGSGTVYGTYNNISNGGTGLRYGNYTFVAAGATNASSILGNYSLVSNAGTGTQYGSYTYLYNTGSGRKYGNYNTINGTSGSSSNIYGTYNNFYPNGTGDAFATFNYIRSNGTGNRYGTYDSVLASSTNTSAIYAMYAYTDHAGSGASYGVRVDANKSASAAGTVFGIYNLTNNSGSGSTYGMYVDANKSAGAAAVYGLYVTSDNDGTGNSYLMRGNSVGSTTGTEYGLYISGEDENYFSNSLGIGRLPATNKLEVNGEASKSTAGSWVSNSDRRIKKDIQTIEQATETLMKLNPVMFHYTDYWRSRNPSIKDHYYYNFIAQEFKEVFPDAVKGSGEYIEGDPNEILQIDTYNAGIVTIKAVQELILRVEALEKENEQLKADKQAVENELRSEIAEIKKLLGIEAKKK